MRIHTPKWNDSNEEEKTNSKQTTEKFLLSNFWPNSPKTIDIHWAMLIATTTKKKRNHSQNAKRKMRNKFIWNLFRKLYGTNFRGAQWHTRNHSDVWQGGFDWIAQINDGRAHENHDVRVSQTNWKRNEKSHKHATNNMEWETCTSPFRFRFSVCVCVFFLSLAFFEQFCGKVNAFRLSLYIFIQKKENIFFCSFVL